MNTLWARKGDVSVFGQRGGASTSLIVMVSVNVPLSPLYAPVPEPESTAAPPDTDTSPEQVVVLVGKCPSMAESRSLSSVAMLSPNEP